MLHRKREYEEDYSRAPAFMEAFRVESQRMHALKPENEPNGAGSDMAVILPILILLLSEGADKYLLLALVYILL